MSGLPRLTGDGRGWGIAVVAALSVGQALAAGAAAIATRDVFAALAADARTVPLPVEALAVLALSGVAIAGLRVVERVVAEKLGQGYAAVLRQKLFTHLSRLPARRLTEQRAGGLTLRFVGDLGAVRNWISLGIARLISAGIVLPGALAAIFVIDLELGLAATLPIGLGLAVMALLGMRFGAAHRRLRSRRAKLATDMAERIPHAAELRLLGRMAVERRQLERRTERMVMAALSRARAAALLRAVPDAASGMAAASVLYMALSADLRTASAAGALAAVGLALQPMRELAGVWDRRRAWVAARRKCEALLARPLRPAGRSDGADPMSRTEGAARGGTGRGPVVLEGQTRTTALATATAPVALAFHMLKAGPLRHIVATLEPGGRVAIRGPNGAGKSLLLTLAAGLEMPEAGRVTLDGVATGRLRAGAIARRVAFVGPRSPILAGSLRRALTMGGSNRPDDTAVTEMARHLGLGSVLDRLGGLDGRVGEGGRTLSSGEARRVLLTRAALSGAGLLLLDEPDDVLDADGPVLLARLFDATPASILYTTHDPRVAALGERVWRVENGQLRIATTPEGRADAA
ncbi:MAG: ABC transporter ATP-binding protein [Pseudomonadota bacterium]